MLFRCADVEIILDRQVKPFFYRLVIVESESGFVDCHKAVYLVRRNDIKIKGITFLLHIFRRMTAEEKWVRRDIEEILPIIIDDIQTAVCIACQGVGHGYASFGFGIVTVSNIHC